MNQAKLIKRDAINAQAGTTIAQAINPVNVATMRASVVAKQAQTHNARQTSRDEWKQLFAQETEKTA